MHFLLQHELVTLPCTLIMRAGLFLLLMSLLTDHFSKTSECEREIFLGSYLTLILKLEAHGMYVSGLVETQIVDTLSPFIGFLFLGY